MATKEMSPESSTMEMERPSTPTKYSTLKALIQTARETSCIPVDLPATTSPAASGSYWSQAAMAASSETRLATSATAREAWASVRRSRRRAQPSMARSTMRTLPRSGAKVAQARTWSGRNMAAFHGGRGAPRREVSG